ncbi:hypothetical protein P4200_08240 [Pseudomonas aeruginosa]|nr:hypothetical protein [Pseudomonas aeruginosa]
MLTPDGSDRPLYCTVFLDEAFSNTAEAVSRRVLKVFRELKIHVNLITPYKNLNLARESARSLLIAERDQDKQRVGSVRSPGRKLTSSWRVMNSRGCKRQPVHWGSKWSQICEGLGTASR